MKRANNRNYLPRLTPGQAGNVSSRIDEGQASALRQELDAAFQRIKERPRDLRHYDVECLTAYASSLNLPGHSAARTHLASVLLGIGAVDNFRHVIDLEGVNEVAYDATMFPLPPDEQAKGLEMLSKTLSSRRHWRGLDVRGVPRLPQHKAHSEARAMLVNALSNCTFEKLSLFLIEDPEEFTNALVPSHGLEELSLVIPRGAFISEQGFAKLCTLLENGLVSDRFILECQFAPNTPMGPHMREAIYPRIATALCSKKGPACLALGIDAALALSLLKAVSLRKGAQVEVLEIIVKNQPDALQINAIADCLARLLVNGKLFSMRLAIPDIQAFNTDLKIKVLQAAVRSTSLIDKFALAHYGFEDPGALSVSDVPHEADLIKVDGRDATQPADGRLETLIHRLAITLHRNRSRALKHNNAFIAGAAGSIEFFMADGIPIAHKDLGQCLASALERAPRRRTQAFKKYDVNGLHLVNKAAWAGAKNSRSEHYLAELRDLLECRDFRAGVDAIARLRTLFRANVLIDAHVFQAFDEIGRLIDAPHGTTVYKSTTHRDLVQWFHDMRRMAAIKPPSDVAAPLSFV